MTAGAPVEANLLYAYYTKSWSQVPSSHRGSQGGYTPSKMSVTVQIPGLPHKTRIDLKEYFYQRFGAYSNLTRPRQDAIILNAPATVTLVSLLPFHEEISDEDLTAWFDRAEAWLAIPARQRPRRIAS